jgi:hypothetical protein
MEIKNYGPFYLSIYLLTYLHLAIAYAGRTSAKIEWWESYVELALQQSKFTTAKKVHMQINARLQKITTVNNPCFMKNMWRNLLKGINCQKTKYCNCLSSPKWFFTS